MSRRALFWLSGAAAALVAAGLAAWTPPDDASATLCLSRRVLSLPCPGCGMTRAASRLLHGDLGGALALHPLVPLAMADVATAWAVWGLVLHGLMAPPPARLVRDLVLAQLALFVALWLGRAATGTLPY